MQGIYDWFAVPENAVMFGFLIVAALLIWRGFPIFLGMLDSKASELSKQLDEVAAVKAEAEALLNDYKAKHAGAMAEAEAIVAQAKDDAARIQEKAEADLAATLARREAAMDARIAQMEARASQEIQRKTVEAALGAARASLAGGAGKGADLIEDAINDLPNRLN